MKLYNTASRKIEAFKPLKKGQVGIYSCGPTVYWHQHIGHMYAYIHWDVLARLLRFFGFKVQWVMNITDVGHLTSEQNLGEDKMEKGAQREGLTVWQIAQKYTRQFMQDLKRLNIQKPDVMPKATEHIKEMIELIAKIEKNGFAYQTSDGLYFDTAKMKHYNQFSGMPLDKLVEGARVEKNPEKKNPTDFALWKFSLQDKKRQMEWSSPWGTGFPGWHIECTAMATKYLGERFDIHTGGQEHITIHHTNEIAQAFGAFGRPVVNYWLHNGWLTLKNVKMSKSLGNLILVTDLIKKGFDPMHFRYLVLTSHYRSGLVFDWQALEAAKTAYQKLLEMVNQWRKGNRKTTTQEGIEKTEEYRQKFIAKMENDLNCPEAIAIIWEMAKSSLPDYDKYDLIRDFDQVLGLRLSAQTKVSVKPPENVVILAKQREKLRQEKNWSEADKIRRQINALGWQIEDTSQGEKLKNNPTPGVG